MISSDERFCKFNQYVRKTFITMKIKCFVRTWNIMRELLSKISTKPNAIQKYHGYRRVSTYRPPLLHNFACLAFAQKGKRSGPIFEPPGVCRRNARQKRSSASGGKNVTRAVELRKAHTLFASMHLLICPAILHWREFFLFNIINFNIINTTSIAAPAGTRLGT